ncbi:preprotein translocase subunit SecD [Methanocaldococcus infernus]
MKKLLKDKRIVIFILAILFSSIVIAVKGIHYGVDITGGTVIVLKTEKPLNERDMSMTVEIIKNRLDATGLGNIEVYSRGNNEIIVIVPASADVDTIIKILKQQGNFKALLDNKTLLYTGRDIANVEFPTKVPSGNTVAYGVPFSLKIDAAKRMAELVKGKAYHRVYLYMDDKLISAPVLSPELTSGKPSPNQVITVGPYPPTEEEKAEALAIYTALKSGALPVKVDIEYTYSISPEFGRELLKGIYIAIALAFIAVSLVVAFRYRSPKLVFPILLTCFSEILIILGIASLINWRIDLPSFAGIVAAVGTGVDNQIVIADEALKGIKRLKASIKRAFFVIFASASTSIAAMLPLFVLGVGLLKGFALTTIIGILIGIFITRPAYAKIVEELFKK